MPTAILLNPDDPLFSFEHMQAHRRYFAMMAPLDRFSALPYLLDPPLHTEIRASDWHLNHSKSHIDFARTLPSEYNAPATPERNPAAQPIMDYNLSNTEYIASWSFQQHREHFLADQAVLPLLTGTWPFW